MKEIKENEEINIQAIEELDKEVAYKNIDYATGWDRKEQIIIEKQNEILKAVKQLDRQFKEGLVESKLDIIMNQDNMCFKSEVISSQLRKK